MIYLDTSAIVKVVVTEPESVALVDWLNDNRDSGWATSVIGHIEVMRAANRAGPATTAAAGRLLGSVDTLVLTDAILTVAKSVGPPELRTLDALHLATALEYRRYLDAVCVYDRRLVEASKAQQLPVVTLGRDEI